MMILLGRLPGFLMRRGTALFDADVGSALHPLR
jgi:hypothetical protein